ncbi:phage minor structural protein GP20 [uncultured Mediterranean phage uvMED]|nr:phage minor structural protein GP20 [uncultured Mediterranean phage uvMED]BAQ93301.1 phage minor structural protein GP20 [uncultured Mediterranean phage uvMED]BAQ93380.1 phage minor structural protein GP20 [uncultured Mediterranean phage uvMED]BAR24587.1 phage minor structural protein GP20 [uncultured Mediterranean phage uvMED]
MEEQVIQETPVATPDQPVAATETPAIDSSVYEQQIKAEKARAEEAEGKFQRIKDKMNALDEKMRSERQKTLEDQGQWKPLWEEANKTAQEKQQQIADLERQLQELRVSNETAAMQTSALAAISQAGAINAQQMLQLVQNGLKKSEDGSVKVLDGGVEQDLGVYLAKLKNPGSGFEHHFKPSTQAGMGAKPSTGTAGAAGVANPWLEGSINLTKQMALDATDPDLAAVLRREAGK